MAATSISCRSFISHHSSHQCLLYNICLIASMSCRSFTSYHGSHQCLLQALYLIPQQSLVSALLCFYEFSHHHHVSAGYMQALKEHIHYGLWKIQCLPMQHFSPAVTTHNNAEIVYVPKHWYWGKSQCHLVCYNIVTAVKTA
jgi:hypothetical protein